MNQVPGLIMHIESASASRIVEGTSPHATIPATPQPFPENEWLPPAAALTRFVAPPDLLWQGTQQAVERNRYGYRIGNLRLLIHADTGSEVMRQAAISSLPGAASWLLGMMNLRGNLVPVFDLSQVLGMPQSEQKPAHKPGAAQLVLILDKGENAVGIVIDAFPEPLTGLRAVTRLPQLPQQLQGHVGSAFFKDEDIWLEFSHQSFFEQLCRTS